MAGVFLLSGAASLIDQVVWLRYLSLIFGNTTWATATLLAVFMGGLGLGALLFGRWADRIQKPLGLYALMEVAIGLFALASPTVLSVIDGTYVVVYRTLGNQPGLFALGRTVLVASFLLLPTILMGGTLPLILRATTRQRDDVGAATALFYGVNTTGAVLGTMFAGFYSIRTVGLFGSLVIAAGLNLIAAVGSLLIARAFALSPKQTPRLLAPPESPVGKGAFLLIALFFLMGSTSLAYEVLWTRILLFHLGSSVYAYSVMLLLVLIGIGTGSLLASPWSDRVRSPLRCLAWVELALALWIPIQILLFQQLDLILLTAAELVPPTTFGRYTLGQILAVLPLLGPPTLLMGVSFPLAVRSVNDRLERLGSDVGRVYGANTLGAVIGSLTAGFLLIPAVGTQQALIVVGAFNAILAMLAAWQAKTKALVAVSLFIASAVLSTALFFSPDRVILSAGLFYGDRPEDLVYFHEDAQATVTIRRREKDNLPYYALAVNGVAVAGTSPELHAVQRMQGHLPMLLGNGIDSVVHIGFGTGGTARAVAQSPVDEILVVELSPEVIKASDTYFGTINHGVLSDPRVRVEINDGRNFLLATNQQFDAVLSDSIHPAYAGNGSLYSLEYFRLIRQRMQPGGIASMWLPTYYLTPDNFAGILRAFAEVFPHTAVWYEPSTLNAFTIVTGKVEGPVWSRDQLQRAFSLPEVGADLRSLGLHEPADLVPLLVATERDLAPWLERAAPHTDDRPRVEYESGRLLDRNRSWLQNFTRLLEMRPDEAPAEYIAELEPDQQERARTLYRQREAVLDRHRQLLTDRLAALDRRSLP